MKPPHCYLCYGAENKWIRQLDLHQSRVVTNDVRRSLRFSGIEMDARPGLAPGKSVLQTDGSTTLPCARINWGVQRDLHPHNGFHRAGYCSYIMASIWILRPALPRYGPHYECGALLTSATEE